MTIPSDIKNNAVYVIEELKKSGLPISIYGIGVFAKIILKHIIASGLSIKSFFVDDKFYPSDYTFITVGDMEFPLQSKSKFLYDTKSEPINVVVGWNDYGKVCDLLDKKNKIFPYSPVVEWFDSVPFHNIDYGYFTQHKDSYINAYNLLECELSKRIFESHIIDKMRGTPEALCTLKEDYDGYYSNELLALNDSDVIIDCGAYTGDTIVEFLQSNSTFSKIYAFEPDPENYRQLSDFAKNYSFVETINAGVYSETTTLKFNASNTLGSALNKHGHVSVDVVALDEYIKQPVSLIKMDIEGSELQALKGASAIIRAYKPKLAICVYHQNKDLFEIPIYIASLFDKQPYKYYLRQHANSFEETVLYAIPK